MSRSKDVCRLLLGWLIICIYLQGCGVEIGNPKNPTGDGGSETVKSTVAKDEDAAVSLISSDIDETVNTVSEDNSNPSQTSLTKAPGRKGILQMLEYFTAERQRSQSCKAETNGHAVVTISANGDKTEKILPRLPRQTRVIKSAGEKERTVDWSSSDGPIVCNNGGTHAMVDFRNYNQLVMDVTFRRAFDFSVTRQITNDLLRQLSFSAEGKRTHTWSKATPSSSDVVTLKAVISKNITRISKFNTKRGGSEKIELTSEIKTDSEAPLVVYHDFSNADASWVSKKIASGTVISTQKDKSRVESTYDDVLFTVAGGCRPVSGKISGKIFDASDLEKAYSTFEVIFSADGAVISLNNGAIKADYVASTCEFESD